MIVSRRALLTRPTIHVLLADYISRANACGDPEQAKIYHASLKEDPKIWDGLELRGHQKTDDSGTQLELRDCARCGSTLAKKIPSGKISS